MPAIVKGTLPPITQLALAQAQEEGGPFNYFGDIKQSKILVLLVTEIGQEVALNSADILSLHSDDATGEVPEQTGSKLRSIKAMIALKLSIFPFLVFF